jgi:Fur family ferric uptake transcriptional regulator
MHTEEMRTVRSRLQQAGLKATRSRLLVMTLLQELGGHRSIEELGQELKKRGTPLPRASLYNVIAVLLDQGLVMLADTGPGRALYEVRLSWHHHFVCTWCGAIIDVPCVKEEKPCLLPEEAPGRIDEAQIIFRGCCSRCLASSEKQEP